MAKHKQTITKQKKSKYMIFHMHKKRDAKFFVKINLVAQISKKLMILIT